MSEVLKAEALGGQFEAVFHRHGIPFELVEEFLLADIVRKPEVQVRAKRTAPKGRTARYEEQMKAGATFPPLVVRKHDYALVDGNTRLQAYNRIGRAAVPVYLVEPRNDAATIILGGALNQLGGAELDPEEARKAAVLMSRMGMVGASIAKELGVSARRVFTWTQIDAAHKHAEELGMEPEFEALSQNSQEVLGKVNRDLVFTELLNGLGHKKPKMPELKELVKRVNEASSDEQAVEDVQRTVMGWPEANGGSAHVPAMSARPKLRTLIDQPADYWVDRVHTDELLPMWRNLSQLSQQVVAMYEQ